MGDETHQQSSSSSPPPSPKFLTQIKNALLKRFNEIPIIYCREIESDESLIKIFELFVRDVETEPTTPVELLYFGIYHKRITENFEKMKVYLLKALEQGETLAATNLGYYYKVEGNDTEQAVKYLLMAIEKGCVFAMTSLAMFYKNHNDKTQMKEYFLRAITLGSINAINSLANYYHDLAQTQKKQKYFEKAEALWLKAIEMDSNKTALGVYHGNISKSMGFLADYYETIKRYDDMEKYYLLSINRGNTISMNNLGFYYETKSPPDYDKARELYLMGIEKGCSDCMVNLGNYYLTVEKNFKQAKFYLKMAIVKKSENAIRILAKHYESSGKQIKAVKTYMINTDKFSLEIKTQFFLNSDLAIQVATDLKRDNDELKKRVIELEFSPIRPKIQCCQDEFETLKV